MKTNRFLSAVLASACFLSACSKTETTAIASAPQLTQEVQAEKPPEFPNQPTANASPQPTDTGPFEGIDANKNGVRDDVETWILTEVKGRDNQYALAQIARAMGVALNQARQNASDEALILAYQGLQKGYMCVTSVNKDSSAGMLVSQVESKMANRPDRAQAYIQMQTRYMKIGFRPLPDNQVKAPCEFEISK